MKIIFQDKDIIAVDKPAGINVHSGIGIIEKTLVDYLLEKFPEIKDVGDDPKLRPGIVHRLDKDTSGVILVARNQESFEYLKNLFKNRKIEKKYAAVVFGKLKQKEGKIEGEMGRSKRDFRKQALSRGKIHTVKYLAKPGASRSEAFNGVYTRNERYSLTYYNVIKETAEYSLVEVFPKTGRTHQIRVHLHSIGHPIVGDQKYTFKRFKKFNAPRMFLHAAEISFETMDGKRMKFESPLPPEFSLGLTPHQSHPRM
jgi:23S rRNA pseudouridine1911/1915/1917 synthase